MRRWLALILLTAAACATGQSAQDQQAQAVAAVAAQPPPALPPPVDTQGQQQAALVAGADSALPAARIDGKPIPAAALAAHQKATGLPRNEALTDLIDLTLLREAAAKQGLPLSPGTPTADEREAAERKLAATLGLELPPDIVSLVVDHAWVKDAATPTARAAQRKAIDQLHDRAAAGQTISAAFQTLTGVKAADWHVGDHEEYPVSVIPAGVRELDAGSVSAVTPGDGGLHLFKIHARKTTPPAFDIVHEALRQRLLENRLIEAIQLPE
ncbi:MAG TPA: hypothetical protein VHU40_10025 [Polyangia bacterium]|nr:hypothetical protein [Polyangia bacterium]